MGHYVVIKPREDGSHRVLFVVPLRLRPPGWPPTLALPLEEPRGGDLSDPDEVRRIRSDAELLYSRLRSEAAGPRPVAVWNPKFDGESLQGNQEAVYQLTIRIVVRVDPAGRATVDADQLSENQKVVRRGAAKRRGISTTS